MFWKKKIIIQIKNQEEEKKTTTKKTKKQAGSTSLLSSFWALVIPRTVHPVLGVHPNPRLLGACTERARRGLVGSSVWERRAGWKPAERKRMVQQALPPPLDSADHQSRCWWRFRLRTERTSAVNLGHEREAINLFDTECLTLLVTKVLVVAQKLLHLTRLPNRVNKESV